ncbi:hypothetical protein [Natrarchaeobius oligotrophus]|uniref:Uncharacterized protein n=1 Tax=Natrarchaeobius chitinivorans TaxID=1679083 RepID=A0A3N6MU01_NATCH|nr:hypothetical protein [Natrarchaeobius chitinivorans]RQG98316.1 hypothetical protein EA472_18050 [Natrarchaeobius chitinivorans]
MMTDLKITTVNDFDQNGIFPLRNVRVGGKKVQTPTAATIPGKLREHEEFHPDSDGVSELYRTVGGDDLDEAMRDPDGSQINSDLESQFSSATDDSLKITFTKYTETSTLGVAHARYLADIHAAYSDIITVPLMPKLVRNVEDDLSDPSYRSFKKSVVAFLNQVQERHPEVPVMGLIPRLGWEFIDDLLGVYEAHDVTTYAFDFDRCKVTTGTQLAMVEPLMQSIANRGIEEHTLFYAINPSPGTRQQALGVRPASDISSLGLGFDIIGGCHVSPRMPEEAFEKMEAEQGEDGEPEFRLFDRTDWVYRDIPVSDLSDVFPDKTAFDAEGVATRVRRSPTNAKYRLQKLVNGEQKALAAKDLRDALASDQAYPQVIEKLGVTDQTQSAYEQARDGFDEERFQSGVSDF